MSTITSLKLGSVPITEEGVERYKFSDTITNHFTQILEFTEDLNCSVGRIFSKMKVPVSWFTVMNANYLIATMDINNPSGSTLNIKAWIDAIDLLSDSEDHPMVEIRWHFDYFEMFKSSVTLGYGHIKRRPYDDMSSTPIQNYPVRFYKRGSVDVDLCDFNNGWTNVMWVIVTYNDTWSIAGASLIKTIAIPIHAANGAEVYIKWNSETRKSLSWSEINRGLLDERFGIPGSAIIGCWLSPVTIFSSGYNKISSGSGTSADPFVEASSPNVSVSKQLKYGGHNADPSDPYIYFYLEWTGYRNEYGVHQGDIGSSIMSSEETRYIVTSPDGLKLLDLPYGFSVRYYSTRAFVNANEAYVQISFSDTANPNALQNTVGMTVNIPMTSIPINSNAYSDYVYSGQRDFDKDNRVLQSQAKAVTSVTSGATTGALIGGFNPMGAAVGGVLGASSGMIGYGVETLWLNDQEQALTDRLMSHQLSSLLLSSSSMQPYLDNLGIHLRSLEPDGYSATQISNMRSNFGISVDEILSSCNTQVKTTAPTGYYVIKNLIISGSAPKEAKDYIKKKFDAGVRLL